MRQVVVFEVETEGNVRYTMNRWYSPNTELITRLKGIKIKLLENRNDAIEAIDIFIAELEGEKTIERLREAFKE